jgi:RNA polymerase sigma-70 factor (ECF subfamily)
MQLDDESREWVRGLTAGSDDRDRAAARLHELMLRVTRGEAARRRATIPSRGAEEIDEICVLAANDAVVAVLAKLDSFRGAARFTTWASKFAIYEVSAALRRHAWRHRKVEIDETVWDRLPDTAPAALDALHNAELMEKIRRVVREDLTERQRLVFESVTLESVPIDVLAERLGSTRGAIYKTLHDARAKVRRALMEAGYEEAVS